MIKRFFDVIIASLFVLLAFPIMLIVAILIRLETSGPVVNRSPRVGKDGKTFRLLRFRTVDVSTPAYLSMSERMTCVGRFIRNCSLDDLPNLFNILKGDLSIIGPRPTEPERVDLEDPTWRQILAVRPGAISPAILLLASKYNSSPHFLKQTLELEYTRKRSFVFDLQLMLQAIQAMVVSKGNPKARGKPLIEANFETYKRESKVSIRANQQYPTPSAWVIADWNQPDLSDVVAFIQVCSEAWDCCIPQFHLVPCGNSEYKPAIFLKVGNDYKQWAHSVELRSVRWPIVWSNRYVCLGFTAYFENVMGEPIAISGETKEKYSRCSETWHRLACSTVLDVASPDVEKWFTAWSKMPGNPMVFFVAHNLENIHCRALSPNDSGASGPKIKALAMQQWEDAKVKLQQSGYAVENFEYERVYLLQKARCREDWETA
jgi:lipopolysaccharide/colanic/teichoic acid biosynthesis glycosyltransferase